MKNIFKKLFKKPQQKKTPKSQYLRSFRSCEDPNTIYAEFPDGLRLIFREGEYVGWYLP